MGGLLIRRNTEGRAVAEVDLDGTTLTVAEIVDRARHAGAELVWAYGGDPTIHGFVPMPGYAHLHVEHPVPGERLPSLEAEAYGPLSGQVYLGQWGHKWVDPTQPLPTDGSTVLGLYEHEVPIGLCRVWPEQTSDRPTRRCSRAPSDAAHSETARRCVCPARPRASGGPQLG